MERGTLEPLQTLPLEELFEAPAFSQALGIPKDPEEIPIDPEKKADETPDVELANGVRRYLQEIGSYPLLTLEEEIELARLIWEGQEAAKEIASLLNASENLVGLVALARVLERPYPEGEGLERAIKEHPLAKRLYQKVRLGEKARVDMVHANLRLVVSVAKRFAYRADGLDLPDLIQEGNRGLLRATYSFDWRRKLKFSTYATWWIRQAITRAIADQGRIIRLPVHFHDAYRKLRAIQGDLEADLGRPPKPEEIAQAMGDGWTAEKVEEALRLGMEAYSLDARVGEGEEDTLGSFLPDENLASPEEAAFRGAMAQAVGKALDALDPRHATILRLRMGLVDGREYTLEEIGHRLGVTKERVRQLEKKAVRQLRAVLQGRGLQEYLR